MPVKKPGNANLIPPSARRREDPVGAVLDADPADTQPTVPNLDEQIAQLAYSYWEARGCQGGSPEEDWLRAETEIRERQG